MKIKGIILLFLLASIGLQHDYYLSTTTIKWLPEKQQIQLTTRFFLEDIEALMEAETGQKVVFHPDTKPEEIDAFVKDFYLRNLLVSLDGEPQKIHYLGREYQDDLLVVYAEILPLSSDFKRFDLSATFLIDFLENQQNIIHLTTPNQKKSFLLSDRQTAFDFRL